MNTAKFDKEFQEAPLPADCVPEEICEQCAAGAVFHHLEQVAAVYCRHSTCGAELPLNGTWHLSYDVTKSEFEEMLLNNLIVAGVLRARKAKAN